MNEEKEENKNGEVPKEFGNVIDALHQKRKLSSLRTYQGDVAEFIKEKNESTISIALKEKEREEKIEKELHLNPRVENQNKNTSSFAIFFGSLVLIGLGAFAFYYAFEYTKQEPVVPIVVEEGVIPYKSSVALSISSSTLSSKISKFSSSATEGVTVFKVSDPEGKIINRSKDLFYVSEITLPSGMERIMKDEYALGVYNDGKETSAFIIIAINDFSRGFSAMLDWEKKMSSDLNFIENGESWDFIESKIKNPDMSSSVATSSGATSTLVMATSSVSATSSKVSLSVASTSTSTKQNIATTTQKSSDKVATTTGTTTIIVTPLMKPEAWSWKDLIIKNKDTRALVNERGEAKIAYTFLDKNTILITSSLSAIGDLSAIYTSKSVAR